MAEEKNLLRLGGLGGLLAGVLAIVGVIIAAVVLGADPGSAEEQIMRYPEQGAGLRAFASLLLGAVILLVTLFLALYRALRETSLALALFGSVLGVLGLVFAAFAFSGQLVIYPFLSNLFHAPGATSEEQATLVLLQGYTFEGIIGAAFFADRLFLAIGFVALGVAMLRAPDFGRGFGGVSVVLGVAGVVGGVLTQFVSAAGVVDIILFFVFPLLFGWKVYSISRGTAR